MAHHVLSRRCDVLWRCHNHVRCRRRHCLGHGRSCIGHCRGCKVCRRHCIARCRRRHGLGLVELGEGEHAVVVLVHGIECRRGRGCCCHDWRPVGHCRRGHVARRRGRILDLLHGGGSCGLSNRRRHIAPWCWWCHGVGGHGLRLAHDRVCWCTLPHIDGRGLVNHARHRLDHLWLRRHHLRLCRHHLRLPRHHLRLPLYHHVRCLPWHHHLGRLAGHHHLGCLA
mmetsp:Transcript_111979/g.229266  ORF Transcript_111979/g.229266 Transcript_111979/m.229266 type:complete len:225 (+) Transcript_111979:899-1573(+)